MYKKKWFRSERAVSNDFYTKTGREIRLDEGALSYEEDGFMQGYEDVAFEMPPEEIV